MNFCQNDILVDSNGRQNKLEYDNSDEDGDEISAIHMALKHMKNNEWSGIPNYSKNIFSVENLSQRSEEYEECVNMEQTVGFFAGNLLKL